MGKAKPNDCKKSGSEKEPTSEDEAHEDKSEDNQNDKKSVSARGRGKPATPRGRGRGKANGVTRPIPDDDVAGGRRGSSRVQIMKLKEAERRKKEEEDALRIFKMMQEKKAEREKRKI